MALETDTDGADGFDDLLAFVESSLSFATSSYNRSYLDRRISARMRRRDVEEYDAYQALLEDDEEELDFETPTEEPRSLDSVPTDSGFTGDRYCGNCVYFEYVDAEDEGRSSPYCDYHETKLDDLEACGAHTVKMSGGKEDSER